jgi:hypothetical protein
VLSSNKLAGIDVIGVPSNVDLNARLANNVKPSNSPEGIVASSLSQNSFSTVVSAVLLASRLLFTDVIPVKENSPNTLVSDVLLSKKPAGIEVRLEQF